jgi:hypothetical protein
MVEISAGQKFKNRPKPADPLGPRRIGSVYAGIPVSAGH